MISIEGELIYGFHNAKSNNGYRIAAAPLFPKLRRFPHGRRFKQWTGDDSKALMKVLDS